MTTVDTMDTRGSIGQIRRMVEAGCEYVRLTAPSMKEAANLENIKKELKKEGIEVPLIADIHFTPNAAELAARIVEKVRINPGNYADKKKFNLIEYSEAEYKDEIERIRDKFLPLIKICREYGTALRIGTNHGSLSDRIMGRYGDTALGMVESALEFLRICDDENFHEVVLSMKSSNPIVMVQAYRLLTQKLNEEGLQPYPLHLGVTEAGEGEDGRIKSSMGIGTLLEDGLGDTIRVSLTEEPENEVPVARLLAARYLHREDHGKIAPIETYPFDPFSYKKKESLQVYNLGGDQLPRVIADFSQKEVITMKDLSAIGHYYLPEPDKWVMKDQGADFIYTGNKQVPFMLPNGLKQIADYKHWQGKKELNIFPLFRKEEYVKAENKHPEINFIQVDAAKVERGSLSAISGDRSAVLILTSDNKARYAEMRRFFIFMREEQIKAPVIIHFRGEEEDVEKLMVDASTDTGALLIDGLGDGLMIAAENLHKECNSLAFGILQASRTRISKTEYISCPSCGRTLFDLQETTALIRQKTDHLKGLKIGIMGCIVNGPGEMADADYGYVGSGKGKITLYKGQNIIKKGVPSQQAVDELIGIIKEDGNWVDP